MGPRDKGFAEQVVSEQIPVKTAADKSMPHPSLPA
jgi:hypothetical protein